MAVTAAAGHLQAPNEMLKILDSTPNLLQYVLYKKDIKFTRHPILRKKTCLNQRILFLNFVDHIVK